jgi:hypothetical protein
MRTTFTILTLTGRFRYGGRWNSFGHEKAQMFFYVPFCGKPFPGNGGLTTMNCCSHLTEISNVTPKTPNGCEECLKLGDRWVHLRLCATCGHVGCCDESKNKHAVKHFQSTSHPFMKSFEPDEDWGWCYVDEVFFESFPNSLTTEWCGVLGVSQR